MAPSRIFSSCSSESLFFYYFRVSEYQLGTPHSCVYLFQFLPFIGLGRTLGRGYLHISKLVSHQIHGAINSTIALGKSSFFVVWECVDPNVDLSVMSICTDEQTLALF